LKTYICMPEKLPTSEIEVAKFLQADLALSEKNGFLTVVYAISEEARENLAKTRFKLLNSEVYESAFVSVFNIQGTKRFLEERFAIEYVSVPKTPD